MQITENTAPQDALVAPGQADETASIEDETKPRKARTNKGRRAKALQKNKKNPITRRAGPGIKST